MDCWAQKIVSMYLIVFLRTNLFLCAVLMISCANKKTQNRLPYYNKPDFTPEFISSGKEAEQKINHRLSSFAMTDQHGKMVTEKDIDGRVHVANFIFTSCAGICPILTKNMKLVQRAFINNPDIVILSYSVTPWIDSVSRLKRYAEANEIVSPNWHLLTGNKNEIYSLARQSYFAEEDLGFTKDSSDFLHTEHVLLLDRSKKIRGIYNGTLQLEMEQLIKDIELLVKEDD